MKGKTFLILLAAAGVLGILLLIRFGDGTGSGEVKMGERLFADFPVNEVATVTLADSENRVTLVKGETVWQVQERDGYPADFDELSDLVVKIARLKIGRSFPGTPESLARLNLLPPSDSAAAARGRQITLTDQAGTTLADLLVGQIRETDAGATAGQYLKRSDADTVYLVDGNFRFLRTAPAQWLKREILNIQADEVATVAVYAADSTDPLVTLSRPGRGEAARMTPVPAGRLADPLKIQQVIDALAPLAVDDVHAAEATGSVEQTASARLEYHLYDGRRISIFPEHDGQDRYTLRVAADESALASTGSGAPRPASPDAEPPHEPGVTPDAAAGAVKTAQQINDELGPWVFSVKKWLHDSFVTDPEKLLQEPEEEPAS